MFRLSLYQEKYTYTRRKDIMKLTQRESAVIRLRYGIALGDHFTHQEIAEIVGISKTMVLLLEKRALRKLRHIKNRDRMTDIKETSDLIESPSA